MRTVPPLLALVVLAIAAPPLAAQHDHGPAAERGVANLPAGWELRLDRPDQDPAGVEFAVMAPGWHVTTGPSTILYHASTTARGEYRVEAEIHLFDPGQRREAFGVFVGGTDLQGENQAYTYFLIRRDGSYIVKRRAGADSPTLAGWTEHAAVRPWTGESATVLNVLAVDVGPEEVGFYVNDQRVASLPRGDLPLDGVVGLRVNHALNLHVSRLDVAQR